MIKLRDHKAVVLFAAHIEAERCWHIFDTDIVRLRPSAAWAILPLGLDIPETLTLVEQFSIQPDRYENFEKYFRILVDRRNNATAAWHAHREGASRHVFN